MSQMGRILHDLREFLKRAIFWTILLSCLPLLLPSLSIASFIGLAIGFHFACAAIGITLLKSLLCAYFRCFSRHQDIWSSRIRSLVLPADDHLPDFTGFLLLREQSCPSNAGVDNHGALDSTTDEVSVDSSHESCREQTWLVQRRQETPCLVQRRQEECSDMDLLGSSGFPIGETDAKECMKVVELCLSQAEDYDCGSSICEEFEDDEQCTLVQEDVYSSPHDGISTGSTRSFCPSLHEEDGLSKLVSSTGDTSLNTNDEFCGGLSTESLRSDGVKARFEEAYEVQGGLSGEVLKSLSSRFNEVLRDDDGHLTLEEILMSPSVSSPNTEQVLTSSSSMNAFRSEDVLTASSGSSCKPGKVYSSDSTQGLLRSSSEENLTKMDLYMSTPSRRSRSSHSTPSSVGENTVGRFVELGIDLEQHIQGLRRIGFEDFVSCSSASSSQEEDMDLSTISRFERLLRFWRAKERGRKSLSLCIEE